MGTTERIKVLWGPGLGALLLSLLSLRLLSDLFPHAALLFALGIRVHYPWFLSLVAIGGLAAYSSRRLGGRPGDRIMASLFPAF